MITVLLSLYLFVAVFSDIYLNYQRICDPLESLWVAIFWPFVIAMAIYIIISKE